MTVLSFICGAVLLITGISCMLRPAATFFNTGYFMTILLLVYGITGIVNVIKKKAYPLRLAVDIPAILIGVIALFRPGTTLLFDSFMVYLFALWFVLQGLLSVYISYSARKIRKGWIWGLILGILGIILGIYSFFHPVVSVISIGLLVGFYLIQAGLDMIVLAAAADTFSEAESGE